jgi:hypothetical protein
VRCSPDLNHCNCGGCHRSGFVTQLAVNISNINPALQTAAQSYVADPTNIAVSVPFSRQLFASLSTDQAFAAGVAANADVSKALLQVLPGGSVDIACARMTSLLPVAPDALKAPWTAAFQCLCPGGIPSVSPTATCLGTVGVAMMAEYDLVETAQTAGAPGGGTGGSTGRRMHEDVTAMRRKQASAMAHQLAEQYMQYRGNYSRQLLQGDTCPNAAAGGAQVGSVKSFCFGTQWEKVFGEYSKVKTGTVCSFSLKLGPLSRLCELSQGVGNVKNSLGCTDMPIRDFLDAIVNAGKATQGLDPEEEARNVAITILGDPLGFEVQCCFPLLVAPGLVDFCVKGGAQVPFFATFGLGSVDLICNPLAPPTFDGLVVTTGRCMDPSFVSKTALTILGDSRTG